MIIALPCLHFSVKERKVIKRCGFLPFPEFLDNHYIAELRARPKWLIRQITRYPNLVQFAIAPDYLYKTALALKERYPHVQWVFPLHKKNEIKYARHFEWVGFPYRGAFRDYSLTWFLRVFKPTHKLWFLGFWEERHPELLLPFDGMDSTIPETYAGEYGKLWLGWGKVIKPSKPMRTITILEHNVRKFKQAVDALMTQKPFPMQCQNPIRGIERGQP